MDRQAWIDHQPSHQANLLRWLAGNGQAWLVLRDLIYLKWLIGNGMISFA